MFYTLHEPNCLSTRISKKKRGMHSTKSWELTLSFHILRSFADSSINMSSEQQQANFGLQGLVKTASSIKTQILGEGKQTIVLLTLLALKLWRYQWNSLPFIFKLSAQSLE